VLSLSTNWLAKSPPPLPGMALSISTRTEPEVQNALMAIGGGPLLVEHGWRHAFGPKPKRKSLPASVTHIWEKHPRSALGWNRDSFFLVAVDGRQPGLSDGMTIKELAAFMKDTLGCAEAMNLDGGGSATLWHDGQVRNVPSDGEERPVANALIIVPGRQE
jgi:exopolysaccharide biosynthesis protein